VTKGASTWALEVKSGTVRGRAGINRFRMKYPDASVLLIGEGGIPLERFFSGPPEAWFT